MSQKEIVTVRPMPSKGRTQFTVYPNCRRIYGAGKDRLGRRITGLTPEEEKELSEALKIDLSPLSPFWTEFRVVLTNKEREFDLSDPASKLEYLVLRTKKEVATSRDKITPWTTYIIHNEIQESEAEMKDFDVQLTAYKYLADMGEEERSDFLKLFGKKTASMKPIVIKKQLRQLAEANPKQFVAIYEDKDKQMKILIEDLIQKKIFTVKNGAYYYGEDMMGPDINLTIANLKNPKKSDLLKAIKIKNEEIKL